MKGPISEVLGLGAHVGGRAMWDATDVVQVTNGEVPYDC